MGLSTMLTELVKYNTQIEENMFLELMMNRIIMMPHIHQHWAIFSSVC